MKRSLTLVAVLLGLVVVPGTQALAKGGDLGPTEGTATIAGPGLSAPIVLHWKGTCLSYCTDDPLHSTPAFVQLASAAGLFGYRGTGSLGPPDQAHLGPRYTLTFVLRSSRMGSALRSSVDLYPYGPSDLPHYIPTMPWIHVGLGQMGLDQIGLDKATWPSGWWPASPLLQKTLGRLGLPALGAVSERSSVPIAGIAGGLVGFVLLLVAGAAFGRPRRRRAPL